MSTSLTPIEKSAAMLVCLGIEKSAQVLAHLSSEEVQLLADEVAHTGRINQKDRETLLSELNLRYSSAELEATSGGLSFVQSLLVELFGEERATLVIEQLTENRNSRPFRAFRAVDARRILDLISSEHPSIIALVVYYLPREKAAQVMAGLPDQLRQQVVMRLVNLKNPLPQIVSRLEQMLLKKLSDDRGFDEDGDRDVGTISGARALVEILGHADHGVERSIYEFLQECDPTLAEEVRKSMFVFEDLMRLESRALQTILREVATQDLALSLKGTSEEMKNLVFNNVSENMGKAIREELELLGPVRVSQVEEAQQKVVSVVRRMADEGVISYHPGDEEELIQ
ncbi:MAG: flagellar motor switch protein FliG [Armatimonadota bacterium]